MTILYDASRSLINKISNMTSTRIKFCNLIADQMFTRNIPLVRVIMFRNNIYVCVYNIGLGEEP